MVFGKKIRFRNFYVLKYKKDGMPFIKVGDIADDWSIEFALTHKMFAALDRIGDSKDEKVWNGAYALFLAWYGMMSIYDAEFYKGVHKLIGEWIESRTAPEESTDKEKEDEREIADMEEELENISHEEGEGNKGAADNAAE